MRTRPRMSRLKGLLQMDRDVSNLVDWLALAWPTEFDGKSVSSGSKLYLAEPTAQKLLAFFEKKGLAAIKAEDRAEAWYDDWIAYLKEHCLYAEVLSPRAFSSAGPRV